MSTAVRAGGRVNRVPVIGASGLVATGMLGASLSVEPGSARFYRLTMAAAAAYVIGGLMSGPVPLAREGAGADERRRSVLGAVLVGAGTFMAFYLVALVARHIPILNRAIGSILGYAHRGAMPLVVMSTLTMGAAEEVYFRGAVYGAVRDPDSYRPAAVSTVIYALATVATRNPALVLASVVMGALFGVQRRSSDGVLAPTVTHLVWSALMLRYLPPLFPLEAAVQADHPDPDQRRAPSARPRPPASEEHRRLHRQSDSITRETRLTMN